MMLLPDTNTSLVKIGSQQLFKEIDRTQVFSVTSFPPTRMATHGQSAFPLFLFLLYPSSECICTNTRAFTWPLVPQLYMALMLLFCFLKMAYFLFPNLRIVSSLDHFRKYRVCIKREKVLTVTPFQHIFSICIFLCTFSNNFV